MRSSSPSTSTPSTLHPFTRLYQKFLFLSAENTNPDNFVRSERNFPPTSGTAADGAVVTEMAHSVRELCLQANLTRRFQLNSSFLLYLGLLLDLLL